MKRVYIIPILMVLLLTTCEEDRPRTNPFDSETELDPSEWAPSNLQVQVIDDSQLKLTWTQEEERILGFRIGRNAGSGGFAQIAQVGKDIIQHTDTGLNFGTSYVYRVSAFTDNNESEYATSTSTTTIFPSPTSLTGTPINDQSIQLTWSDNCVFEDGYRLERSEDGVSFTQIAELGENVTEYTDAGLNYGTDYAYRVKAFTDINESEYATSNTTNTSFPSPTNLTATPIDDQSIQLFWNDNCVFEHGYRLERSNGESYAQIAELGVNIMEYMDVSLIYGSDYSYRVKAFTDNNESDYSMSNTTTMNIPPPTNLTGALIDDQSIQLIWSDNCVFEHGYRLERSEDGVSFTQIVEVGENVTEYTNTGLNYGTDYTYRVNAFTEENESDYAISNTTTMTIPSPTGLTGTSIDDQSIQLTWSDNCSFEAGYRLERSEDGVLFTQVSELGANITEYTDMGLNYGTDYTYRVKAFTDINVSDYSISIAVGTVFPSPTDVEGTPIDDQSINLTWSHNCNFEDGYRLVRSADSVGGSFSQIAEVNADVSQYTDTGLSLGIDYTYRIKAFTEENESDFAETTVNFWYDCNQEWGGTAIEDCNGDCDGTAIENECGCVGGNTGLELSFCYGCTDPDAINYDFDATFDDGSCEYSPELLENFSDISDWTIDLQCGSSSWINNCSVNYSDWEYENNGYAGSCVIANSGGYFYGTRINKTFIFPSDGKITFWYKGNHLTLYINYSYVWSESNGAWTQGEINVSAGTNTISFSREGGAGETWLDELGFVP